MALAGAHSVPDAYGSGGMGGSYQPQLDAPPLQQQAQQWGPPAAYAYAPPPQQQQQQQQATLGGGGEYGAPGMSTLMDSVTAPRHPAAPPASPWTVHYAADGRLYYYNSFDGSTQWEKPPGL